jgi:anti-sigma factor RsiW
MKVCAQNRKAVALFAIDALEAPQAESLRAHLASCGGCREYLREIEQMAETIRTLEAPEVEASPFLQRRVRNRLLEAPPRPVLPWKLLLPALGAMVFVLFVFPRSHHDAPVATPVTSIVQTIAPTVLNYEMAANQSLEKLDVILAKQGNLALPATSVYRADSLGNSAD